MDQDGGRDLVLVTGISGFIAKRLALALLASGYRVRGTLRSLERSGEVRLALERAGADARRLSFAEADLSSDAGWAEAADGCDLVQHVASPFPIEPPRDREALVPAARDGTLRVLAAARAAGAGRVVLTSSMVAMMYRPDRPPRFDVREDDWTDTSWEPLTAYIVSKTRAERAAWEWAREAGWEDRLTAVNPGFVLGPALDDRIGTSLDVVRLILEGALPAIPPAAFPVVDVRDLARLYVEAMRRPETGGRRLMAAAEALSLPEMADVLREALPERSRRIPRWTLPASLVPLLAKFDRSLASLRADLRVRPVARTDYVTELTGVSFRPAAEAVVAAGRSLIEHGVI